MLPVYFPRRAGPPLAEPITLARALVHLREDSDGGENDAYIQSLIAVAREACEERCERTLITTPLLLTMDAFETCIDLRSPPVASVQSVVYTDVDGDEQTVPPADYVLDPTSNPARLLPAPGKSWPATQADAVGAVRVAYTAGYGDTEASVPTPIKQWMLLAIGEMYELRSASAERPAVAHHFADALLRPYQILGV